MSTEKPRYTITVDDDLFQQIEDFRFEQRFPTRSKATEALIKLGLEKLNADRNRETQDYTINETDAVLENR